MKLNEFQELSKRTMPYNGAPANQAEFENMLGNYAMGLVGESAELLSEIVENEHDENHLENVLKELGDVSHYAVGLAELTNSKINIKPLTPQIKYLPEIDSSYATIRAGVIVEVAKKQIYHRHDLDIKKIRAHLISLMQRIQLIADWYGYSLSDVFTANIDKLKTRYPEKFNTADSINRVDVATNK